MTNKISSTDQHKKPGKQCGNTKDNAIVIDADANSDKAESSNLPMQKIENSSQQPASDPAAPQKTPADANGTVHQTDLRTFAQTEEPQKGPSRTEPIDQEPDGQAAIPLEEAEEMSPQHVPDDQEALGNQVPKQQSQMAPGQIAELTGPANRSSARQVLEVRDQNESEDQNMDVSLEQQANEELQIQPQAQDQSTNEKETEQIQPQAQDQPVASVHEIEQVKPDSATAHRSQQSAAQPSENRASNEDVDMIASPVAENSQKRVTEKQDEEMADDLIPVKATAEMNANEERTNPRTPYNTTMPTITNEQLQTQKECENDTWYVDVAESNTIDEAAILKSGLCRLEKYTKRRNIDNELFSFKTLLKDYKQKSVEVQRQVPNFDEKNKKQGQCFKEVAFDNKLGSYLLTNGTIKPPRQPRKGGKLTHGSGGEEIYFLQALDIPADSRQAKQLSENVHPQFFLQNNYDLLSNLGKLISGTTQPVALLKEKGNWTGGHVEPLCTQSANINHGPNDSVWYAVPKSQKQRLIKLLQDKNIDVNKDRFKWFLDEKTLKDNRIQYKRVIQKPGDMIITGAGTFHWVVSKGQTVNTAWNFAQSDPEQLQIMFDSNEEHEDFRIPLGLLLVNCITQKPQKVTDLVRDKCIELLPKTQWYKRQRENRELLKSIESIKEAELILSKEEQTISLYCPNPNCEKPLDRLALQVQQKAKVCYLCLDCFQRDNHTTNQYAVLFTDRQLFELQQSAQNIADQIEEREIDELTKMIKESRGCLQEDVESGSELERRKLPLFEYICGLQDHTKARQLVEQLLDYEANHRAGQLEAIQSGNFALFYLLDDKKQFSKEILQAVLALRDEYETECNKIIIEHGKRLSASQTQPGADFKSETKTEDTNKYKLQDTDTQYANNDQPSLFTVRLNVFQPGHRNKQLYNRNAQILTFKELTEKAWCGFLAHVIFELVISTKGGYQSRDRHIVPLDKLKQVMEALFEANGAKGQAIQYLESVGVQLALAHHRYMNTSAPIDLHHMSAELSDHAAELGACVFEHQSGNYFVEAPKLVSAKGEKANYKDHFLCSMQVYGIVWPAFSVFANMKSEETYKQLSVGCFTVSKEQYPNVAVNNLMTLVVTKHRIDFEARNTPSIAKIQAATPIWVTPLALKSLAVYKQQNTTKKTRELMNFCDPSQAETSALRFLFREAIGCLYNLSKIATELLVNALILKLYKELKEAFEASVDAPRTTKQREFSKDQHFKTFTSCPCKLLDELKKHGYSSTHIRRGDVWRIHVPKMQFTELLKFAEARGWKHSSKVLSTSKPCNMPCQNYKVNHSTSVNETVCKRLMSKLNVCLLKDPETSRTVSICAQTLSRFVLDLLVSKADDTYKKLSFPQPTQEGLVLFQLPANCLADYMEDFQKLGCRVKRFYELHGDVPRQFWCITVPSSSHPQPAEEFTVEFRGESVTKTLNEHDTAKGRQLPNR